jgi:5-methyltetrahydrofolate--homocysteine methyltransferase
VQENRGHVPGRFLSAIAAGPLLLDAGMGVRLMLDFGLDCESDDPSLWNLEHPEHVFEFHRRDVAAGSDVLVTNTFGANPAWLERFDKAREWAEINRLAVDLARDAAGPDRLLAGSIGPTASEADSAYRSQAEVLADSGVDALLLETHRIEQALAGLSALRRAFQLPIVVSLAILPESSSEAARRLVEAGADVIGVNCVRPETARAFVEAVCIGPLWYKPGAMYPGLPSIGPDEFARDVPDLLRGGVRMIGGCCGATDAHVAALRIALDTALSAGL